ncbi:hypothetical protein MM1218R_01482 [Mycobacterium marinum]|uniref:DNA translocase FtsK n=1 Tax=Mycobacterium marinum TaxID=1781 RepID=UPI000E28AE8C|nr:DNA translocase FtsK [Mycobacterium marinum]AXN43430.1 hypothetical protein MM1218R_01482 [Mycobacterium marinum]RFZ11518.1 hypothetical protein DE4381_01106 [Mycobacterium marinum]
MTITISTVKFIETLTDALQCADDDPEAMGPGIHIATHRAPHGDEPGNLDLLAVTSTDRFVIGHTSIVVTGQVVPSVWPPDATKTVLTICKQLVTARGKEHTVDVEVVEVVPDGEVSGDEQPSHPGYVVTLCETPALFDTDTEFQFHAGHESRFPLATAHQVLSGHAKREDRIVDGPETQWSPHVLAPLTAIAKRRKSVMQFFRYADQRPHLVQIGPYWLGAAMPVLCPPGEGLNEPSIDPLIAAPAAASDELRDALAAMNADGITVTVDNPKGAVAQTLADALESAD